MTKAQRIALMAELWPEACRTQGWHAEDRELRLFVCSVAVSGAIGTGHKIERMEDWLEAFHCAEPPARVLKSTNELDDHEDFTRVKTLLRLLSDRVEIDTDQERKMRFVLQQQIKCLALYLGSEHKANAYVASIRAFNPKLVNIIRTVNNRLHNKRNGFRVKAGDSLHEMCMKANIKCHCKQCSEAAVAKVEEPF